MKFDYSVGVVGHGFVGGAVAAGCRKITDVKVFDSDPKRSTHPFGDVAEQDIVFVCVPTPTNSGTGACDLTILTTVVARLQKAQAQGVPVGVVTIKSTIPPGFVNALRDRYSLLRFVSNPEFLTERTAEKDFANPTRVILGHDHDVFAGRLVDLYLKISNTNVIHASHDEAALIKYASNCFFAAKVSFFNELNEICAKLGARFGHVRKGMLTSGWVNPMHTLVPGPDGHLGFGGKCFPKDVQALAWFAREIGIDPVMLDATLKKNLQVRDVKDWEHIKGAFS